jgi:hypothetical protein
MAGCDADEPIYFVQTPQQVWILWQRDHLVRRVYLNDGPHWIRVW